MRLPALLLPFILAALPSCKPAAEPTSAPRVPPAPALPPAPAPEAPAEPVAAEAKEEKPVEQKKVEAPYDLEEDTKQLTAEAKEDLGDKATVDRLRSVFLVIGAPGWGRGQSAGTLVFIERVLAAFENNRFSKGPQRALPVYLFGDAASYDAYCEKRYQEKCASIYGFFSHADYRLVMNVGLGIGTLSHELTHPYVTADFPDAPVWINEGIASLFEQPIMPKKGEIHGAKNWRYKRLSAALRTPAERGLVSLPALFALTDRKFRGDHEGLHYAMARYFCQWMDAKGKLWPFYQKWRDTASKDPRGEGAFREVMGVLPSDANDEWLRWVKGLLKARAPARAAPRQASPPERLRAPERTARGGCWSCPWCRGSMAYRHRRRSCLGGFARRPDRPHACPSIDRSRPGWEGPGWARRPPVPGPTRSGWGAARRVWSRGSARGPRPRRRAPARERGWTGGWPCW